MRLQTSKTKNAESFYIVESIYVDGKRSNKIVKRSGRTKTHMNGAVSRQRSLLRNSSMKKKIASLSSMIRQGV